MNRVLRLKTLYKRFVGEFAHNAGLVMLGTLVAQVLPLLFYPIFTRLFAPADFGTFATASTIAMCLAILASGSYEQAFLIIRSRSAVLALFRFLMVRCAAIIVPCSALLFVFRDFVADVMDDPALRSALLLVPLIAFGQIVYNSTSEWLVREKAFTQLTLNRIAQSFALSLAKLGFGLGGWVGPGLVFGEALGRVAYSVDVYRRIWRKPLSSVRTSRKRAWATGLRHRNFPRLMVPDQLINTFVGSVHIIFIGAAFGPTEVGYVSLLFSALYLPITVVSSSVKDVFRQRASVDYAAHGTCRPLYRRLLLPVTLLGLLGFGMLYVVSPWLFVFVFGESWERVGAYAQILVPVFFFNFVAMSLGGVLVIAQRMDVSLRWQVTSLILALGALLAGTQTVGTMEATLLLFTIARSCSYVHYMIISYKHAKRPDARRQADAQITKGP